ncbi:hypothetical protein [Lacipirellula parvula]|uniref:Uncharacterized protein n=1 Tax=Lacipirellula parvula TaxID=2650471 RepID=A0A5K7XJY0_9BACT|nr:hypothetical protein [Lacipirellula parvula]BBO34736.1 hypothetical protein PLANPX_4348 [Lacipirellula parvula]
MIFTVTVSSDVSVSLFDNPEYLMTARQIARDPRCAIKGVVCEVGEPDG